RLVALTYQLDTCDTLKRERKAPTGATQLANGDHRHEDAEAAVVASAVSHRVVMGARQERLRVRLGAAIDADDVADRVDLDAVEAALAHPADELRGGGAVRVGEVGDGQLAVLGVARVGVARQQLGTVPRLLAEDRPDAEAVGEAQLGDAVDG